MGKSQVEKYEQILSSDPASTVFVELAKALIAEGEHARAVQVCEAGLGHHPRSVAGRVLWGKALIHQGRPAEAMEQFDRAIAIHKDNPHAYNLISEVLIQKGLYRSALPLLRKAVALQPNDARVREWLEQTQKALQGGPPPVLGELTPFQDPEPESQQTPFASPPPPPVDEDRNGADGIPADSGFIPVARPKGVQNSPAGQTPVPPTDPFSAIPLGGDEEVMPGLTSVFQAISKAAPPAPEPGPDSTEDLVFDGRDLLAGVPTEPKQSIPQLAEEQALKPQSFGLLGDLPEPSGMFEAEPPKTEVSAQVTDAIAKEYEQQLRVQVAAKISQKTFLQRHGWKLAVGGTLGFAVLVAGLFYFSTRAQNQGQDLQDALAAAKKGILQDGPDTVRSALSSLALAARMAPDNPESKALTAYAHGLIYADYDRDPQHIAKAKEALASPGARERFAHLAAAADYYLSEGKAHEDALAKIQDFHDARAEVLEIQGRIELEKKQFGAAVEKLKQALTVDSRSVRTLASLGNYYKDAGDCPQALELFERARQISSRHPEAVLGTAQCQLEQEQELENALSAVRLLPVEGLGNRLGARRALVEGRLLSALSLHSEALAKLEEGVGKFPESAFEFNLALGKASFAAGKLEAAQRSLEAAFKLRPHSEETKEALARLLLVRGRGRDVLSRITAEQGERKVFLVRGVAAAKVGDARLARAEFAKTQVKGKVPQEAVMYLALLDAADGEVASAQQVLEKLLASAKRRRAEIQVALGKLYLQQKLADKARAQFEAASKDPGDSEGSAALGQLLLEERNYEAAAPLLRQAAARNPSLQDARVALVKTLLSLGQREEALKEAQAEVEDNAGSSAAQKAYALALWQNGKLKEAEKASALSVKIDSGDPEAQRVRAGILFALGDGQSGFQSLERANKLNSKDPETFCEIGMALLRQGHADYALQAFEAAKRESSQTPCVVWGPLWARLPFASRSTIRDLEELLKGNLSASERAFALATLARSQSNAGSLSEARKSAEEAVEMAPWSGLTHYASGLVAVRQKDEAKAREAFGRATALEPSYGQVRLALGDLLVKGGAEDQAKAIKEYQAFLAAGGPSGEMSRVKKALPQLRKRLASR